MEIAAHNLQEENRDVNNLWHWPTEYRKLISGYSSNDVFQPELMKWMSAADVGFILRDSDLCCKFTDHSVSGMRNSGYQAAVFLNLKPGKYVMSFMSDIDCSIMFVKYVFQDDVNVKFGNSRTGVSCNAGFNDVEFEIPDDILMMFQFYGLPEGRWVTLTDIKIREGVL